MDVSPDVIQWLGDHMSCRRFARHVSSDADPLAGGLSGRFHFWLHWAICPFCRRYWDEIKAIGEAQRAASALRNHPVVKIPEIKSRLKATLRSRYA